MALTCKTYKQTCLIEIRRGDRVIEKDHEKRTGKVIDFRLVPNGINDPKLVCLIVVELDSGNRVVSSSDNWTPIEDDFYLECYPSILIDVGREGEAAQKADGKLPPAIDNPISMIELQ
jgi:hypothetical protein